MANIQMTCYSNSLHVNVEFDMILPQPVSHEIGMNSGTRRERYPVLWLLHGATDDHTTWQRRTSIERYAASMGLAVVMPNGHLSSYVNMAHGENFYDFVAKELPALVYRVFPISDRREDNYIAGNSMGGYGAMMIGINNPDRYAAIGCLSAAARKGNRSNVTNKGAQELFRSSVQARFDTLLYDNQDTTGTMWDTWYMADKNKSCKVLPRIFHTIGKDDFLIEEARETRDFFESMPGNPYQYVYEEHEGIHEWEYWDAHIQDFLRFLQLPEPEQRVK